MGAHQEAVSAPRRPDACAWCGGPIPAASAGGRQRRRDSVTCRKECRQARHRFAGAVPPAELAGGRPLRFCYADPPYPGLARRYYACPEVDHRELVDRLVADYPDGWALSTSSAALRDVLLLCPADVRVAVWVRGARPGASRRPRDAWEPLIVRGGRLYDRAPDELCNVFTGSPSARARSHPGALVGMKSSAFAAWMFAQLGAARGDELVDLFPGSGAVGRAWRLHTGAPELPPAAAATRQQYLGDASDLVGATRIEASNDALRGRARPVEPGSSTRRRGPARQNSKRPASREEGPQP